jgi:hypothetical protein
MIHICEGDCPATRLVEQTLEVSHINHRRPDHHFAIVTDDEVNAIAGVQVEVIPDCLWHDQLSFGAELCGEHRSRPRAEVMSYYRASILHSSKA